MENRLFEENQRMTLWFVVLIVIIVTGIMWYGLVQQLYYGIPFGTEPASDSVLLMLWILFGIGFPIFFLNLRLKTTITNREISVQFKPLMLRKRSFAFSDITSIDVETYHPIKEFWGYGIRVNLKGATAYNVKGNKGLRIRLRDGREVLIGTQKPEAIEEVLSDLGVINK